MNTKKNTTGRKATAAAKSATNTITSQRKARAARFAEIAEATVAKMSGDRRALLDAAAESVGMSAADFVARQVQEERGLGSRRDLETQENLKIDDWYENESTTRRNNHEREVVRHVGDMYGFTHAAGLTIDEELAVVRRYFRLGDDYLGEAEGRAIKDALAMPSPGKMKRVEIEIAAAARIVGKTADDFIREWIETGIDAAKDLNGGKLDFTADERDALEILTTR